MGYPHPTSLIGNLFFGNRLNGRGTKKNVKLIRFNPNGTIIQQKIDLDLSQDLNAKNNPILQNNDLIVVGRSSKAKVTDTVSDAFKVLGLLLRVPF